MVDRIRLHFPNPVIQGTIHLDGSKSISNRALIMQALAGNPNPELDHLSTSVDTRLMQKLLSSGEGVLDAGAAGTTFRFLTAYLATREKELILTGSERMKQRPIGELVNTLNELGAGIEFLERDGYPPLRFTGKKLIQVKNKIRIRATISSQYISALLMIAPALPGGLEIELIGEVISRPYIEMTLAMMKHFGINTSWVDDRIHIEPQSYQSRPLFVEGDWSAASYYYSLAAIAKEAHLDLYGIKDNSLQGDSAIASIARFFNIKTQYHSDHVTLTKSNQPLPSSIEWDFIQCPDLAQTVFTMCAATGVKGAFTGLQTLRIKETDRIAAMKAELKKVNVPFFQLPSRMSKQNEYHMVEGKVHFEEIPVFSTYEDHRMAMCLAPLALLHPIEIEHPAVVGKSYPEFWRDLQSLGGVVEEV